MKKIKVVILELLLAMYLIIAILFPPYKYTNESKGGYYEISHFEFKRYEYLFSNPPTIIWEKENVKRDFKRNLLYGELAVECLLGIIVYGLSLVIKNKVSKLKDDVKS